MTTSALENLALYSLAALIGLLGGLAEFWAYCLVCEALERMR